MDESSDPTSDKSLLPSFNNAPTIDEYIVFSLQLFMFILVFSGHVAQNFWWETELSMASMVRIRWRRAADKVFVVTSSKPWGSVTCLSTPTVCAEAHREVVWEHFHDKSYR